MGLKGSWRTTASMAVAAVAYLMDQWAAPALAGREVSLTGILTPEFLGTVLDIVTAVALLAAGLASRDNKVTSEQAIGVKAVEQAKETVKVEERAAKIA